jgi:hypothetical protein
MCPRVWDGKSPVQALHAWGLEVGTQGALSMPVLGSEDSV